jgi:AcrR family transcriptional regulator
MYSTKNKILNASIKLFNEYGVASVRLQQIADEIGISVGNLAYHFKTKDFIVSSVYEKLFDDFNLILGNYLLSPSLEDFDKQISSYFDFFDKYHFYFSDLFSNEHQIPKIKEEWNSLINKMDLQIKKRLEFYAKSGFFKEINRNNLQTVTDNVLLTLIFWIPQQKMQCKIVSLFRYKNAIWCLILPYISNEGFPELQKVLNDNNLL